jgi:rhodanese-related sulfurtransferase
MRRPGLRAVSTGRITRRGLLLCALATTAWRAQAIETPTTEWSQLKARIRRNYPDVAQLTVPELVVWLGDPKRTPPLLLDVRSAAEFSDGHLAGAVRAETLTQARAALLNVPSDKPVVLYCAVGMRSSKLGTALLALGRPNVFNLEGSAFEWANAGLPLVNGREATDKTHPYDQHWGRFLDRKHWSRQP